MMFPHEGNKGEKCEAQKLADSFSHVADKRINIYV